MTVTHRRTRALAGLLVAVALVAAACGGDDDEAADDDAGLAGTLEIAAGQCADAGVTAGSWFRMVQPGGTVTDGPFVVNGDSPCGDKTWTPLTAGADGGLRLGGYQANPDPAFDPAGNATAAGITKPTTWFAVAFALATNETDPQTGKKVSAPVVTKDGSRLRGDLRAFAAAWNGQHFNQGSPKPDGSKPGNTTGPTGTYDASSKAYALDWSSQIVGGPFDNFTGVWHLEGMHSAPAEGD